MKHHRIFRSAAFLLLAAALLFSWMPGSAPLLPAAAAQEAGEEISVAGLTLRTHVPYTVYLEPAPNCTPAFAPFRVTMEFDSATSCVVTRDGQSIKMGRMNNSKFIDLFSLSMDMSDQLIIGGTCDTNCADADFAVRVTTWVQGEKALPLFSSEAVIPEAWKTTPAPAEPEEPPVTFRAGDLTLSQDVTYRVLISPGEACDKTFDSFTVPIRFISDLGAYFVTSQYKNVSSVYPATVYREDSGWIEFSSMSGKFWGMIGPGKDGADWSISVVGLEKNLAQLFHNVAAVKKPAEPLPAPAPEVAAVDYDPEFYFYGGSIRGSEKTVYTQLVQALENCEDTVTLKDPVSNTDLSRIFWYVLIDQPQIFWTSRRYEPISYSNGLVTKVQLYYNDLAGNLAQEKARVEAAVEKILRAAQGMSVLEAERCIHDYLAANTVYVSGSPNNQNLYSTLVAGETVCAGYARAFQYIMQRLGVPCYYCRGMTTDREGNQGAHAWNLIKLKDGWYNVDVTWDDWYREPNKTFSCISYEYYNVTDRFISGEHARNEWSERFPACSASGASVERLYGHDWQTETAASGNAAIVRSVDEYFQLCYDSLLRGGLGETTVRFVVPSASLRDRIVAQFDTKDYENGFFRPFLKASKLQGNIYYRSYAWTWSGVGSRGNCYYFEVTHTVARK